MKSRRGFAVSSLHIDGVTTISASGALDAATAAELCGAVRTAVAGCRCLAVDMSELTVLDTTGIDALVTAHQHASEGGASFVILDPPDQARRVLQAAGVDSVIPIREQLRFT
jgi:anti-anti-sigma factor